MQARIQSLGAARLLSWLLRVSFYLWVVGLIVLFFTLLFSKEFRVTVTLPLELKPESYQINIPGLNQTGLPIDKLEARVKLEGEAKKLVAWGYLPFMLAAAALGWILYALWKVFDSIVQGQPFIQPNVMRLRSIGWLILAMFLLKGTEGLYQSWLARQFTAEGAVVLSVIDGWYLNIDLLNPLGPNGLLFAASLATLALAEVFQFAGVLMRERDSLREDQELTV